MIAEDLILTLRPAANPRADPTHRQIYEQIRRSVLEGRLRPGDRLPSTRDLAAKLGLARNTVARAYADLLAEGYLAGRTGSGTYVASALATGAPDGGSAGGSSPGPTDGARPLADWGARVMREVPDTTRAPALPYDFRIGTPDWAGFPRAIWLRLLGRAIRREVDELARYGEPAGYPPLREAIARHLVLSRGVVATADRVVIVSGTQQAIDLLARIWVRPGDAVAVEEPGYPEARRVLAAVGARVAAVPVDGAGLDVDRLSRRSDAAEARLVYVTPSHQFPTGVTLSLARRVALLEWAARRDVLIVEDDYDSEFRYSGRPVESLQGLDRASRVVYVGTFSTVLFPPLRVGYVVLPPDLVEPFVKAKWLADRQTPTLEQVALAEFLAEGHFGQHLRRTRRLAAERREALVSALAEHLGRGVELPGSATGMHLTLRLPARPGLAARERESDVAARAAERGVGVYPSAPYYAGAVAAPALLLGFAALPVERIREGVRRLAEVIGPSRSR